MKQITTNIISKEELMPGTFLISFFTREIAVQAKPGQFLMIDCGEDFTLRRPISIHDCTYDGEIKILFKITGKGTQSLANKKKNDKLDILGPLGNGFSVSEKPGNILLLAGGLGIAPLVFLANRCLSKKRKTTLILGSSTREQLYPSSLLSCGLELIQVTEDGSSGKKGMITDFIKDYLTKFDQVFACGPVPMYKTLVKTLKSVKITKPAQVSLEIRMGCGFGVCYGCTIKTSSGIKQVCTEGPIFNIDEIDWGWLKI